MCAPHVVFAPLLDAVAPDAARWIPDGALAVDEHGRIAFAGSARDLPGHLASLPAEHSSDLLLPAFVDTHVHLPQLDARGRYAGTLLTWLDELIYPMEARFADAAIARDTARRFFAALAAAGTGTAMVYGSIHTEATSIAFEEAQRAGLRIILGKMQMDCHAPAALTEDTQQSLRDTEQLIERWHRATPLLRYAVSPRFAPVCSPELLAGCGALAQRYGTHVQTHLNETLDEIARVRSVHPAAAHYTAVYDAAALLHERTVLGHDIHPGDDELDLIAARGCAVAHCPDSNLFLGSGCFPLERHAARGIRIGLGTDVGAGTSLSMHRTMRAMAHVQQRALDPFLLLHTATLGGAHALGLDDETGALEPGLSADYTLLSLEPVLSGRIPFESISARDIASVAVYRSGGADIRRTVVAGTCVH